ncbi:unnamed protein product [Linum trigynum]|uniref:Retrotransposon gag domain-containing protein n=1 Tax=Linum trigynum TaxID=586398 RepID=A0AAV2GQQ2_9ROSI
MPTPTWHYGSGNPSRGYPDLQGGYQGYYGSGISSRGHGFSYGQPWRAPGSDRYGSCYPSYEGANGIVFRAKPPTIEFPKFKGQEDAGLWLYATERWFQNHPISEERKAYQASFHLEGDVLQWWEWMERSYTAAETLITWAMFQEELRYQFEKSEGWAPEQLAKLKQTSTVADYRAEFFKLSNQCKGVPEDTLVGLCMASVKPEIAAAVRVFEPGSLKAAFCLTGHKEEELASWRSTIGRYTRPSGGGSSSGGNGGGAAAGNAVGASTGGGNPAPVTRGGPRSIPKGFYRLSPAEIEHKRWEGKCFNCDGRFTIGHQCSKPDLMMLVGRWEDEAVDEAEDDEHGEKETQ